MLQLSKLMCKSNTANNWYIQTFFPINYDITPILLNSAKLSNLHLLSLGSVNKMDPDSCIICQIQYLYWSYNAIKCGISDECQDK